MATRDEQKVTEALRERLRYDHGLGRLRAVEHYQRLFAGFDELVAREHAEVVAAARAAADAAANAANAASADAGTAANGGALPRGADRPSSWGDDGRGAVPDRNRVGPYRLLRELGRGGQGTVHLAEDTRLARQVALKTLAPALAASQGMLDRFRREAAAASRLDHPGICTVFEAGESGGVPYIAMRYVDGETLAARIAAARGGVAPGSSDGATPASGASTAGTGARDSAGGADTVAGPGAVRSSVARREDVMQIVAIGEKVARALHAAHEAGLVHRDMKPANVMISKDGEPVVLDFGLAREEDGDGAGITMTGALLGTPAYMSPEQLTAQRIRLDRRTDVYSLGVTLYEALTLRLPFEAPTRDGMYQKILTTDAPNPRRWNAAIPGDLKVVLETAMEKDRDRRYLTALDLAEDLRRVRDMQPIRARPVGQIVRFGRWTQRNPALAGAVGALFASLVGGLVVTVSLLRDARTERDDKVLALAASERERVAKEAALGRAEALRLAVQSAETLRSDPTLALLLAVESAKRQDGPDARSALAAALAGCAEERTLEGHDAAVTGAVFTPDGARIVSTAADGSACVWDAATGHRLVAFDAGRPVTTAPVVVHGGRRAAALMEGSALGIWDLATGRLAALVPDIEDSSEQPGLRVSPDGAVVAALRRGGLRPVIVSGADGAVRELSPPPGIAEPWTLTEFSDDGRLIAGWCLSRSADGQYFESEKTTHLTVWDVRDGRVVWEGGSLVGRLGARPFRAAVAGGPATSLVVLRSEGDKQICGEFDLASGAWTKWPELPETARRWDVHGDLLLATDGWSRAFVARPGFPSAPTVLTGHAERILGLRTMPDGRVLSWSPDGTARLWDAATGKSLTTLRGAGGGMGQTMSLDVDSAGGRARRIVTSRSSSGWVRVWRADGSGSAPTILQTTTSQWGTELWWSPDGRLAALGGSPVVVYDVANRRAAFRCDPEAVWGRPIGFSASGRVVVVHTQTRVVAFSVPDGGEVWTIPVPAGRDCSSAFDPDRTHVIVGLCSPAEGHVIRADDGDTRRLDVPPEADAVLESTGVGSSYVTGRNSQLRLWSADAGRLLPPVDAPFGGLLVRALSGGRFWTADVDGRIFVRSRADASVLTAAPRPGMGQAIDSAGDLVLTASPTDIAIWDTRTGRLVGAVPFEVQTYSQVSMSADARLYLQYRRSDGTVRVWDVATGELQLSLGGASAAAVQAGFTPDARHVVTISRDGEFTLWPLDALAAAGSALPRELTLEERVRFLGEPQDRAAAARVAAAVAAAAEQTAAPAEARRLLRARGDLDASEMRAAMRAVQTWPNGWELMQRIWPVVLRGGDAETVRTSLREARAAYSMIPDALGARVGLGGVLYRAGEFDELIRFLEPAEVPADDNERGVRAVECVLLAMAHHRLGHGEAAARAFAEFQEFRKTPSIASQLDVIALGAEAERILAEPPPAPAQSPK